MDILTSNAQDQLFSSISAVLEPDSGTGADRKPTTKKIAATLERARDFHRVAEASQRDLRASLLSPTTKADELPAMRLRHDGYGFLIERLAPLIVKLDERLSSRKALEANEQRAALQADARMKFEKALIDAEGAFAMLEKAVQSFEALDAASIAARQLDVPVNHPDAAIFGQPMNTNKLRAFAADIKRHIRDHEGRAEISERAKRNAEWKKAAAETQSIALEANQRAYRRVAQEGGDLRKMEQYREEERQKIIAERSGHRLPEPMR